MKKDKLWAKFKIQEELESWDGVEGGIDEDGVNYVLNIIDQLEEPEVLSQEWVDNNVVHVRGLGDIIEAEAVENIIVPNQELPVVPKYVGEFIEEVKASGDSLDDAFSILRGIYHQSKVADWVAKENHNSEIFARAWLDGYTVEEEQKYLVNILDEGIGAYLIYYPKSGNYGVTGVLDDSKGITRFTEQEIKDYDERFWPFAVEVAE